MLLGVHEESHSISLFNLLKKKKKNQTQNTNKNETYIINNQHLPWIWEGGWT